MFASCRPDSYLVAIFSTYVAMRELQFRTQKMKVPVSQSFEIYVLTDSANLPLYA